MCVNGRHQGSIDKPLDRRGGGEGERGSGRERESERVKVKGREVNDIHVSSLCPPTALYDVKRCRN